MVPLPQSGGNNVGHLSELPLVHVITVTSTSLGERDLRETRGEGDVLILRTLSLGEEDGPRGTQTGYDLAFRSPSVFPGTDGLDKGQVVVQNHPQVTHTARTRLGKLSHPPRAPP